jgi:hypothetical protein
VKLLERIGAPLVAPGRAMREAVNATQGRGATDVAWLMAARIVCGETPRLVRSWYRGVELGAGAGIQGVIATVQTVLPDLVGILVAALVMSLLAGSAPKRAPNEPVPADALDVAAYAWVPYLCIQMAAAVYFSLRGLPPSLRTQWIVTGLSLAWAAVVWVFGLIALRDKRRGVGA